MGKTNDIRLLTHSAEIFAEGKKENFSGLMVVTFRSPQGFDPTLRPHQFHAEDFLIETFDGETPFTMQTDSYIEIERHDAGSCEVRLK